MNAIVQVDTQNLEQEAQVLEAVEAISINHGSDDDLLEDSPHAPPTPIAMPSLSAVSKTAPQPGPAAAPPNPGQKSGIKHGFF